MATDIGAIIDNLCSFYDMKGKSVVHVGAGGGQLIGYAAHVNSVIAVDTDRDAVTHLKAAIQQMGMTDRRQIAPVDGWPETALALL